MNYKLYDNGQIMKVISEGHEVAHCMNKEIHFSNYDNVKINEDKDIQVTYVVFDLEQGKHITDTSINKDADFKIEVDGTTVLDTPLAITNGEATITLNTPNAGKHILFVDNYRCEVIVDEG